MTVVHRCCDDGSTTLQTAVGFLLEGEVPGSQLDSFGDALWWSSSLVTTIGIPLLRSDSQLTRGPRINIPPAPPDGAPVALGANAVDKYARTGWVDLRLANFEVWRERLQRLVRCRPDIASHGSAAFDVASYSGSTFVPGDVVGWLLTTETDEQGMVGHRLY